MATYSTPIQRWLYQGAPASNGYVNVYQTGTTTPVTIYNDGALTSPAANPITLDSNGSCAFYVSSALALRMDAYTTGGTLIESVDPVYPVPNLAGLTATASQINAVADPTSTPYVTPQQYGALGDGMTDDTAAFQSAIASGYPVFVPKSTAGYVVSTISLPSNTTIFGVGSRTKILHTGSSNLFVLSGTDISISGFYVDGTNLTGACSTLYIDSTATRERLSISNIYTTNGRGLLSDANSSGLIITLKVTDVSARLHQGPGVTLTDAYAFIELTNVYVDYTGLSVASNFAAYSFTGNQGLTLRNVEVSGSSGIISGTNSSQVGFAFNNCEAVYMWRTFADACGGGGYSLANGCNYIRIDDCTASLCNGTGWSFSGALNVVASNIYAHGRQGQAGAASSTDGILITNSSQFLTLSAVQATYNTGYGVQSDNCSNVVVSGGQMAFNTLRGWVADGSSSVTLVTGVQFYQNAAGNYATGVAADLVQACQLDGTGVSNTAGPQTV